MTKRKVKIGFDLDGVILYNPIRTFRFLSKSLKFIKPIIFKQKKEPFYVPKTRLEKFLWFLLHKSSLWIAPGYYDLKRLTEKNLVEAYLVSGRYGCLSNDFHRWSKIFKNDKVFKKIYYNEKSVQPNIYKQSLIDQLKLDYFIEDNWDIIEKINSKTKTKIIWISNLVDFHIDYPYKFLSLKKAVGFIKQLTSSRP